MRLVAALVLVTMLAGCFGYRSASKKWAYVGDTLLVLGGGGTLAWGVLDKPNPCDGGGCAYQSEIRGGMVAGALLIAAGIAGFIFNATRETPKPLSAGR